jgi:predicted heme/steroid binding protein
MKKEYSLSTMIYQFQSEICYYSQRQLLATCPYEKAHYERLINARTQQLINFIKYASSIPIERDSDFQRQKEFTLEELSTYDGANGRPAYVAVNGTVYDISKEATWGGGTHFGLFAGKDLSAQFMGCHKGMLETLNKLPKVGVLKK